MTTRVGEGSIPKRTNNHTKMTDCMKSKINKNIKSLKTQENLSAVLLYPHQKSKNGKRLTTSID